MDVKSSVIIDDLNPLKFHVSQNYPEPAKNFTTIKYCIPYKSLVQLKIYNQNGDELEVPLNEIKNPGTYEITINTENYPNGKYLYLLNTEMFSIIKRMNIQKK